MWTPVKLFLLAVAIAAFASGLWSRGPQEGGFQPTIRGLPYFLKSLTPSKATTTFLQLSVADRSDQRFAKRTRANQILGD